MRRIVRFLKKHKNLAMGVQAAMWVVAHARGDSIQTEEAGAARGVKNKRRDDTGAYHFGNDTKQFVGLANAVYDFATKLQDEQNKLHDRLVNLSEVQRTMDRLEDSYDRTTSSSAAVRDIAANLDPSKVTSPRLRVPLEKSKQSEIDPSLTPDQAGLWLQAYNAGPYALLKYQGHVPYRETMNYVPRVFRYYRQDLTKTPYEPYIQAAADKYGLDPQMIRAIMKTESDFENSTVSHAGARGLMQVMPVVWKDIKARYDLPWEYTTGVFEPDKNIEVACAYLAWLRYDFLPRHFAEFESNPVAPVAMIRDQAPPRKTPRILASAVPANLLVTLALPGKTLTTEIAKVVAPSVQRSIASVPMVSRPEPKPVPSNKPLRAIASAAKTASVKITTDARQKSARTASTVKAAPSATQKLAAVARKAPATSNKSSDKALASAGSMAPRSVASASVRLAAPQTKGAAVGVPLAKVTVPQGVKIKAAVAAAEVKTASRKAPAVSRDLKPLHKPAAPQPAQTTERKKAPNLIEMATGPKRSIGNNS